jgi:hypothetical protein
MVMGREQSYFISILQKNRHRSIDQEGTELSSCFSGIYASLAGEERLVRHAADTAQHAAFLSYWAKQFATKQNLKYRIFIC